MGCKVNGFGQAFLLFPIVFFTLYVIGLEADYQLIIKWIWFELLFRRPGFLQHLLELAITGP